jgi:hypothetical protein
VINATALCDAGGKKWSNFIELDGTKAFIAELEVGSDASQPTIDQILDGPNHLRGTWVCKELAVKLATWISPTFEVQVMRWALQPVEDNEIISRKRKLEMVELDQKIVEYHQKIIGHHLYFKKVLQDLGSWEEQDDLRLGGQVKCLLGLQNPEPGDIDISTVAKDLGCGDISST